MTIAGEGDVGIGTGNPYSKLHISNADGGSAPTVTIDEQTGSPAALAGTGQIWVKDNVPNNLMFTNDAGTDHVISAYPPGYINGLIPHCAFLNTTTTTALDTLPEPQRNLYIAPGSCADSTGTFNLTLNSPLTKETDVTFVPGGTVSDGPMGGKGPTTVSAATWYRVFVIGGPNVSTDAGISFNRDARDLLIRAADTTTSVGSGNATTIDPNGYTKYRQIGWIRTMGLTVDITPYHISEHHRNYIRWVAPLLIIQQLAWTAGVREWVYVDKVVPPFCALDMTFVSRIGSYAGAVWNNDEGQDNYYWAIGPSPHSNFQLPASGVNTGLGWMFPHNFTRSGYDSDAHGHHTHIGHENFPALNISSTNHIIPCYAVPEIITECNRSRRSGGVNTSYGADSALIYGDGYYYDPSSAAEASAFH
jgi:hypothetical protein